MALLYSLSQCIDEQSEPEGQNYQYLVLNVCFKVVEMTDLAYLTILGALASPLEVVT